MCTVVTRLLSYKSLFNLLYGFEQVPALHIAAILKVIIHKSRDEPFFSYRIWYLGWFGPIGSTENFRMGCKVCYFWGQLFYVFMDNFFQNLFKKCCSVRTKKFHNLGWENLTACLIYNEFDYPMPTHNDPETRIYFWKPLSHKSGPLYLLNCIFQKVKARLIM